MAGAGFKDFTAGEVLTADDVDQYLMQQTVMVFAGTAARSAALGTLVSEGMFSYRTDDNILEYYTGAEWQEYAATTTVGRNLLYNGAMQISQRGTSETGITSGGYYTADRWRTTMVGLGTWTQTIEADAPTGSGFANSLKMDCTTADASPAAGDYLLIDQRLEGKDLQEIKKGSSNAESLTLSFWVKANLTGTYVVNLSDDDNSRQVSAQYTIDASDTWERKAITFPPDTVGALDNDGNRSFTLQMRLGAGSDRTSGTLQTAWTASVDADLAVGQVNLAGSDSYYWQVTGVQLETGTVANRFEFKSEVQELVECQRYYIKIASTTQRAIFAGYANGTTSCQGVHFLPVAMRVPPTLESSSGTNYYRFNSASSPTVDSLTLLSTFNNTLALGITATTNTSVTTGDGGILRTNLADAYVAADSEL